MDKDKILIAGAGLVGPVLAIALKKRGYPVTLLEKRSDLRLAGAESGRSINLIITAKGLKAVSDQGLMSEVLKITTPVRGRMMHSLEGDLKFQPYGRDDSEYNHSVSRAELSQLLVTEAEKLGVDVRFEEALETIDFEGKTASFSQSKAVPYGRFFGADGAGSQTRTEMNRVIGEEMVVSIETLGVDYKELYMPMKSSGEYPIREDALHIWPRGNHMLMALPNSDGSFTMTLFIPPSAFDELDSREILKEYFEKNYSDSISLMPNLQEDFFKNPQGFLGTVRTDHWVFKNEVCILGDAAHAIVPFFGQGMNSAFQDVTTLCKLLNEHSDNWSEVLPKFQKIQKVDSDAIADMAIENFTIMADRVGGEGYLIRKQVEHVLENEFPDRYRSRYGIVTYTLVPYHLAQEAGRIQNEILDELCMNLKDVSELDMKLADQLISEKFIPFLKKHDLSLAKYVS